MAQQEIQLDRERLCCSICLDLLRDPVTIPCGHGYCMNCIKSHWDKEEQSRVHSCPQCRQTFRPRPVLAKNTILADLVEEVKKTGLRAAPADHCYAGPGDVACHLCSGRKRKATKSCVQCRVSYCEQHLQPHYEVAPLKRHKLLEASADTQEKVCSRHNEVMKMFCRTDQQCICHGCSLEQHKDHETVSAAAERTERQGKLRASWQTIQQRIQDREKDVKALQQEVEIINHSADEAVRDSGKISNDLIHEIRKRTSGLKHLIKSRQKAEVSRVKELQKKRQQEIAELRRKHAELQQLSQTEDHAQLFHSYPSLSSLTESTDLPSIKIHPPRHFEDLMAAASQLRDKVQVVLREEFIEICMNDSSPTWADVDEPMTRAEFLQYSQHITLDPNTAHSEVSVSEGNRKATNMEVSQLYPSHPDRFSDMFQVLSNEGVSRRCYWEVECSGGGVSVAVSYKDINTTGEESGFGNNVKSWSLECPFRGNYLFKHNSRSSSLSGPQSSRVGVYLDHRAGLLSFYSVSETMTLLHRVQTTFTHPLHAGLGVQYCGSTAEFCEPN